MGQLVTTIHLLHSQNCCHLDLSPENTMMRGGLAETEDGSVRIEEPFCKLVDFGVAQVFETKHFECNRHQLTLSNAVYLAPKVYSGEVYDARSADCWSLG